MQTRSSGPAANPGGNGGGPGGAQTGRRRRLGGLLVLPVLFLALRLEVLADEAGPAPVTLPEYTLKAGYLLKFTRYVEWPEVAFASPEAPLVIGVLGADPFGPALDQTVAGQKSHNRGIVVRRVDSVEAAAGCHVVFIARRQERWEAAWLAGLRDRPVLTVTETERGLELGSVLALILDESRGGTRVVFLASQPAARRAGLQLSSSMLMYARRVVRDGATAGGGR